MKTIFKPMKSIWTIPDQTKSFQSFRSPNMDLNRNLSIKLPNETGKNDGPVCSNEQLVNYKKNWDKILPPKVISQLRRTGDIMHGSYSVNLQMPEEFHRKAHDIDIWSKKPALRSTQMENTIDKYVGCDIAHVKEQLIGKAAPKKQTLKPQPLNKKKNSKSEFIRYTVITEPENDVDVDYSSIPTDRELKTRNLNGIKHETLDSALDRAYDMRYRPMRASRAREDIRRIEAYMKTQNRKKRKINRKW